ncbi:ras-related protein rapC [Eurytemora carolleeae]|uniref:ras-related protein rapC n=1 Tax=Eurytemora carolleeae TaxID=1294199 RepID=UPI000C76FBD4|nr:ras-related protein rapC [Eurytemora carolleeae]|eukprot:XP_023330150.1 ras-related protein rapC-like [Eurytemora affinis]
MAKIRSLKSSLAFAPRRVLTQQGCPAGCGAARLPSKKYHATTCLGASARRILKIDFALLIKMEGEGERIRLVVMGDRQNTTFQDKYKPTVEDLYSEDFTVGDSKLKVDFLDTAGDDQFPVMRRLSITSGHAFLLVYSVTDPSSLELIQTRIEEIQQQRPDFKELPIVIAGNKVDLADEGREIFIEDVIDWAAYTIPNKRLKVVECSARDTYNVNGVFKAFLEISNIPQASSSLRRGTSAYAKLKFTNQNDGKSLHSRIKSLKLPTRFGSEKRRPLPTTVVTQPSERVSPISLPSPSLNSLPSSPITPSSCSPSSRISSSPIFDFNMRIHWKKGEKQAQEQNSIAENTSRSVEERKPRSRSLVRRSSNKIRRKVNETKPEDCTVS